MSWDTPNYAVPGLMPVTSPKSEKALSLSPESIFFEPHVEGDNWEGIPTIGPVLFNGVQPSATLVSMRVIFYKDIFTLDELVLHSPDNVLIVDAVTWEATVPVVPGGEFTLVAGTYKWIIETTDSDGVVRSLYRGILEVKDKRPS